jgi:hypothetical protein
MYAEHKAAVCQVQGADDIASDGGLLVILAPINVWSARTTSTIENVGWSDSFKYFHDISPVFHADRRLLNGLALAFEELVQVACDPTIATPDEEGLWTLLNELEGALVDAISGIDWQSHHLELLFIWNAQRATRREMIILVTKRQLGEMSRICSFQGHECMQGVTLGIVKGWTETLT